MENLVISRQKGVAIVKKESLPMPKIGETFLLKTGAKLYHLAGQNWMIGGYHWNGDDVKPYRN